jgi:UDP-N-acetylglucosamine acyltransferase
VIAQDVLPFSNTVTEREARVFGANVTGLKRRAFTPAAIDSLHKAFRLLTHSNLNTSQALERIAVEIEPSAELDELVQFIRSSERGFIK